MLHFQIFSYSNKLNPSAHSQRSGKLSWRAAGDARIFWHSPRVSVVFWGHFRTGSGGPRFLSCCGQEMGGESGEGEGRASQQSWGQLWPTTKKLKMKMKMR
jgi:hypothetical protein